MADNYLNKTVLGYFYNRIKTVFASKTEFDTLSDTVDSLVEAGGEPNVIDTVKVNGTALTPDANKAVDVPVPTFFSDLPNPDRLQGGLVISDGLTDAELLVEETNFSVSDVTVNGVYIQTYKTDASRGLLKILPTTQGLQAYVEAKTPTKTSDLTNDSDFQTSTDVQDAIDTALADITGFDFEVVQSLPQTGEKGIIYLVPNSGSAPNTYDEYIWIDGDPTGSFEKIGTTAVDLSNYWTMTSGQSNSLTAITTAEIDELFE